MKLTRPDLAALAICALSLVGIIILTALHTTVPEILTTTALISLSAGVGIATQSITSTTAPQAVSEPLEPYAAAPVVIPTQQSAAGAPVATHAP